MKYPTCKDVVGKCALPNVKVSRQPESYKSALLQMDCVYVKPVVEVNSDCILLDYMSVFLGLWMIPRLQQY